MADDRSRASLLALVVLAVIVRLTALVAAVDAVPVLDEKLYVQRAQALLDGEGFVGSWQSWVRHDDSPMMADLPQYTGAYQPPGYTVFVAAVLALGGSPWVVKLAQVLLSSLTVWVVFLIGRSWFDRRHGLIAAGICAFYPNLIAFSHYLWSETLFILLFTWAVWWLCRRDPGPTTLDSLIAGVLLGLAALTRGWVIYFLPLVVLWGAWGHRRGSRRMLMTSAGCLVLGVVVLVAPWAVRNSLLHDGLVLIDTNGPFNLWRGNAPGAYSDRDAPLGGTYATPFSWLPLMPVARFNQRALVETVRAESGDPMPTDLVVARTASRLAWRSIVRDPLGFVGRGFVKLVDTWNPTSFLMRHFRIGAYGPVHPWIEGSVGLLAVTTYMAVMVLAAVGAAGRLRCRRTWLVLSLVLFLSAVHAATFGLTRFRLPVMPLAFVLAAHGVERVRVWRSRAWIE